MNVIGRLATVIILLAVGATLPAQVDAASGGEGSILVIVNAPLDSGIGFALEFKGTDIAPTCSETSYAQFSPAFLCTSLVDGVYTPSLVGVPDGMVDTGWRCVEVGPDVVAPIADLSGGRSGQCSINVFPPSLLVETANDLDGEPAELSCFAVVEADRDRCEAEGFGRYTPVFVGLPDEYSRVFSCTEYLVGPVTEVVELPWAAVEAGDELWDCFGWFWPSLRLRAGDGQFAIPDGLAVSLVAVEGTDVSETCSVVDEYELRVVQCLGVPDGDYAISATVEGEEVTVRCQVWDHDVVEVPTWYWDETGAVTIVDDPALRDASAAECEVGFEPGSGPQAPVTTITTPVIASTLPPTGMASGAGVAAGLVGFVLGLGLLVVARRRSTV